MPRIQVTANYSATESGNRFPLQAQQQGQRGLVFTPTVANIRQPLKIQSLFKFCQGDQGQHFSCHTFAMDKEAMPAR